MVWIGKWVQVPHIFHKIPSARAHRQNKLQIRMKLSCIYHGMIVFLFKGGDNISNRNYTTLGLNYISHNSHSKIPEHTRIPNCKRKHPNFASLVSHGPPTSNINDFK